MEGLIFVILRYDVNGNLHSKLAGIFSKWQTTGENKIMPHYSTHYLHIDKKESCLRLSLALRVLISIFFAKALGTFWMTSSFQPLTRKRKPNGPD